MSEREQLDALYARFTFDMVAREAFEHLHFGLWRGIPHAPQNLERAQQAYADAIVALIPAATGRVLDVGCGLGSIARMLAERGMEVIAVSPVEAHCQAIARAAPERITVRNARFEALEPDTEVDLVLCAESFNFLVDGPEDLEPFLERCTRWLGEHGSLLVADFLTDPVAAALETPAGYRSTGCQDVTDEILYSLDVLQERFARHARPYGELLLGVVETLDRRLYQDLTALLDEAPNEAIRSLLSGSLADRQMAEKRRYLFWKLERSTP